MSTQQQDTNAELHRRRDELAERVASLHWDLGGLCYEMAIRDHFRLEVLVKRAALLQEADAELGEVERLMAEQEQGVSGQCRSCGAPHSRGAAFCWRCGQGLQNAAPVGNGMTMHLDAAGSPLPTTTVSDHLPRFPPSGDGPLHTN